MAHMEDSLRTYRHSTTGRIGAFDPRVAAADPHLIEVEPGTKPLAYTSIPEEAVEVALALQETEEQESDAAPAPKNKRSK